MSFVNLLLELLSRPSTSYLLLPFILPSSYSRRKGNRKGYTEEGKLTDSSPDLIVHGVLGAERSMEAIKDEMRGILERLVRYSFILSTISRRSYGRMMKQGKNKRLTN
jgi:hypothetical protein